MRRGQVTIFIVVGMVLIILMGFFFMLIGNSSKNKLDKGNFDTQNIELKIEDCIKKTGVDGLKLLGQNGNYMEVPDLLKFEGTSFWIYQYANNEPVFNSSVDEFQKWFDSKFTSCLNFDDFSEYGFEYSNSNTTITYGAEEVIFNVNFPINITYEGDVKNLNSFIYKSILDIGEF